MEQPLNTRTAVQRFSRSLYSQKLRYLPVYLKQEVSTPLNAYTEALNGKSADF